MLFSSHLREYYNYDHININTYIITYVNLETDYIDLNNDSKLFISMHADDLYYLHRISGMTHNFIIILVIDRPLYIKVGRNIDYVIKTCMDSDYPDDKCSVILKNEQDDGIKLKTFFDLISTEHKLLSNAFYIIGGCYRINVMTYIHKLETHIMTYDDEADIFLIKYDNLNYCIIGLALKYYDYARDLAESLELMLKSGKPISSTNGAHFPLSYSDDSTFTLENTNVACLDDNINILLKKELGELINNRPA